MRIVDIILKLRSLSSNVVDKVRHEDHAHEIYEDENTDFTHLFPSMILIIKKKMIRITV